MYKYLCLYRYFKADQSRFVNGNAKIKDTLHGEISILPPTFKRDLQPKN